MGNIKLIVVVALCLVFVTAASARQANWVKLNNQALKLYQQGKYAEASRVAEQALKVAEKTFGPNHPNTATFLNLLASINFAQSQVLPSGDFDAWRRDMLNKNAQAEHFWQRSLAIMEKTRGKDHPDTATIIHNLAVIYAWRSKHSEAEELYKRSLAIREKVLGKDHPDTARTLAGLAVLYAGQGKFLQAEPLYQRFLAIMEKTRGKDHPDIANTQHNLAVFYGSHGKYSEAEKLYERCLAIREKVLGEDHPDTDSTLGNLAVIYERLGKYSEAEPLRQRSVAIGEKRLGKDHLGVAYRLQCLALLYKEQGKYSEAEPLCKRSLAIYENYEKAMGKDHSGRADSLTNLAALYVAEGKYSEAEPLYKMSLTISENVWGKGSPGTAVSLQGLGHLYQQKGMHAEALRMFEDSLNTPKGKRFATPAEQALIAGVYLDQGEFEKAERFVKGSRDDSFLGRFYLLTSRYDEAKTHYGKLLEEAEKTRNADNLFTAYTGLGKAYERLEDYRKAEEYYEKGMKFTEELRSGLLPAERTNFFEVKVNGFPRSEPAKGLTRVRMKLNQAAGSIDSSEVTRARGFSDNIALRSRSGYYGVPQQMLKKEDGLVSRVAALKKELGKTDKDKSPDKYQNISKEVRNAETELNTFVQTLWEKYKPYAAVKYPRPVTLRESSLKPEEYAVIFDASGEGVGVKLIKGKEIAATSFVKWKSEDLEKDVRKFRLPFEQMKLPEFDPELGKSLYKRLLLAVLAHVPEGTPLVIIPDGILAVLPFEALVVSGQPTWKEAGYRSYPAGLTYLGDLYPISYYQSITALTLARTLTSNEKRGPKTMVIADPIFGPDDDRIKEASAQQRQQLLAALPEKLMSIQDQTGVTFPRLSRTAELAEFLKKLSPDKTDLYTGMEAKKSTLFDKPLNEYGCIVFATHGYFGKDIPGIQEPILAMTLVDQPKDRDGFLRMTEVMSMKLNADIVALTACQTGIGSNLSGEGVMSMGRAFQYAGAKSILMSLWSVAESSSVELVGSFFKHLKEGKNKLEALRLARSEIRKAGYDHPFFWAAFILVGEVD